LIEANADKLVDLSVTLSEHLPGTWPEHMPFAHKNWSWHEEAELPSGASSCSLGPYVTHFIIIDEHAGTHVARPPTTSRHPAPSCRMRGRWARPAPRSSTSRS
jgi:kynurenine formamidase